MPEVPSPLFHTELRSMSYLNKIWHNADYPCIDPALLRRRSHLHRMWSREDAADRVISWFGWKKGAPKTNEVLLLASSGIR